MVLGFVSEQLVLWGHRELCIQSWVFVLLEDVPMFGVGSQEYCPE